MNQAFLTAGVTGIRDMGSTVPLDSLRAWRRAVAAGTKAGLRVVATGPYITDDGSPLGDDSSAGPSRWPPQIGATTPEEGRQAVAWFKAHGADFIKLHGSFSREVYFAVAAEARRLRIPFAGHLPETVTMAEASACPTEIPDLTTIFAAGSGSSTRFFRTTRSCSREPTSPCGTHTV